MARSKSYYLAALNIKTDIHSPQKYYDLINETFKSKKNVIVRGDECAIIGSCYSLTKDNPLNGVYGDIYKYTEIDAAADWFNILKEEEATDEEKREIHIPQNLRPNFSKFSYFFLPTKHRLVLVTNNDKGKTFSINTARKFFYILLNNEELSEVYGDVEVIVEQSLEKLEQIFKMNSINTLSIMISIPNPDDLDSEEEKVKKKLLDSQNVRKLEYHYQSKKGLTIRPNADTMTLSRVAVSNGSVKVTGKDMEGNPTQISTESHPIYSTIKYNSDKEQYRDLINTSANDFIKKIVTK